MKSKMWCSDNDVTGMVELLIDNIFVEFGGHIVQQNTGINIRTNYVPHIVDRFLYSHDAEFVQTPTKDNKLHKLKPVFSLSSLLMMFFQ